jgi:ElaB/YqjD/DUF883 family membrane-anchored ribosome-binding protein
MATSTTGTQGTEKSFDRMGQTAHQYVDRAAEVAGSMAERFGETSEQLLAMKDTWVETTREYVKENPIQAVGIAVAAGYLLSMIMRSR